MSRALIVHGLNRPAYKKETTMGEASLVFLHNGTTKVLGLEQTTENPYTFVDTYNQQQIKTTTGDHLQSANTIVNGRRDVTFDTTTAIHKNSFIANASKFYQYYTYTGKLFDTTISAIVNGATYSTITVDAATNIAKGQEVELSGRADSAEDKIYKIIGVDGTDITIDALVDAGDLTGAFSSTIGVHTLKVQSDTCDKYLENSYTMWLPNNFPNTDNDCENGELATGLAPKEFNLDLVAATEQVMMRGKTYERTYDNQPLYTTDTNTTDYLVPNTTNDGFSAIDTGVLEWYDDVNSVWRELDTDTLTCNTVMGLNEENSVFRANKFSRVIVDGLDVGGTYTAIVYEEDDLNSISNQIINKRADEQNTIPGRVKLINEDGTGFYVEGNISFMNPQVPTKDLGGFKFTTDYMFTKKDNYSNVELTVLNNYTQDLSAYL